VVVGAVGVAGYTAGVTGISSFVDLLPYPAALLDAEGLIVHINRPHESIVEAGSGLLRTALAAMYREGGDRKTMEFFLSRVRGGESVAVVNEDFFLPTPGGDRLPVLVSVSAVPLNGSAKAREAKVGTLVTFVDIRQLKESEAALREHFVYVSQLSDTALEQALALKRRSKEAEEAAEQLRTQELILKSQAEELQDRAEELRDHATELETVNRELERRVAQRTAELRQANLDAIYMLAVASEAKDHDTGSHVRRIRGLAEATAKAMGFAETEAYDIGLAAVLHDVGKIHVPDAILAKPGPLTPDERSTMQQHTLWGQRILPDRPFFQRSRMIARSHHENHDGSGYPDGLAGDTIPVEARIVHVADVYDALVSPRPYKDGWPSEKAREELRSKSGSMFDPAVVRAFERTVAS
jgi:response regulator RpfG family c-di-GMP phosphodiesterase